MRSPVRIAILGGTTFLLSAAPLHAQSQPDSLVGVWGRDVTFGPALRGELTVERDKSSWRATIAGDEARFQAPGSSLRIAFPGRLGQFRGAVTDGGRTIRGFWIQPVGVELDAAHASPLTLRLVAPHRWRGNVVPLDDRFSLFLAISRTASGALVGAFRNPELNLRGGAPQYRVARQRDSLIFTAGPDTIKPLVRFAAWLDSANRQIILNWPPAGNSEYNEATLPEQLTLALSMLVPEKAAGLYPRIPRGLAYAYAPPEQNEDGWKSDRASATSMNEAALAQLIQRIADTVPTGMRAPLIHSLLIAHHGRLVLEEYFYGWDRDRVHDTRSAAKTFASVMLGAAMLRGAPISSETPVAEVLSQRTPFASSDPRKSRITLANLMTHTSGLACDDNDSASPGGEDRMQSQRVQPDWAKYTLDLPMAHDPGSARAYCSGGANLVGAAVAAATHSWLPAFFDSTIARPLGFGSYYYNLTPVMDGYTGGGVFMRPRDLLKIGQVYLNGGTWNGRRIVSRDWVALSTAKHAEWPAQGENVQAGADGYMWHLNTVTSRGKKYREYEANGNGGQFLIVLPELDLAVVFTAGNYQQGGIWHWFRDDIVPNAIIPAITK